MSSVEHAPTSVHQEPCVSHGGHGEHADPKPAPGHSDGGTGGLDLAAKLALDTGGADLGFLGALAHGAGVHGDHAQSYDAHVALTLDPSSLPDIDSTLDALTSSHNLFDVPALDVACLDDALPT
jgi:hypothetical protein